MRHRFGRRSGGIACRRRVIGTLLVQLVLAAGVCGPARAGPAVPEAALPGFADPLERLTRAPATDDNAVIAAPGGEAPPAAAEPADGSPVTIIGSPGADPLADEESEDVLDAVRDRFLGRRAAVPDDTPVAANAAAGDAPTRSLAAIMRGLLNAVPGGGGPSRAGVAPRRRGPQVGDDSEGGSFVNDTVATLVNEILNPKVTADGLVTFSIAGLGNFALMLSGETGSVFLVDLDRGTAVKVYEEQHSLNLQDIRQAPLPGANGGSLPGSSNALQRLLDFLHEYVYPILTSPITLSAAGLFSVIWLIWRLSLNRA